MAYNDYAPSINKIIKEDGKFYTLDGFPIDLSQANEIYINSQALADKRINADGGITELLDGVSSDAIAIKVDDDTTDIPLKRGYYKVLDNDGSLYFVFVDYDLNIGASEVIRDVLGYVRLQGVKFPCYLAIKNFTTSTGNTDNAFITLESNFPSPIGIKSLVR